ncbi:MAG: cupin domain-containing protein [Alphaproteobacteria bacterium]|nr:MAG: cupin domain-containing protein [Alphaproteobacteria bacterium]
MSEGLVIGYDEIEVFSRGDGVETRLMVGKGNAPQTPFTTGTTVFPPGAGAPMHSHNCAEQVTVLAGRAEAVIDGARAELGPLDTSFVPAGVPHRFVNIGEEPLVILWIYGARDVTRTFTETGETVPHMSPRDKV